ncbi:sugar-transfer associated ATP-grasp domain-containing protein [Roseovarius sp. 2305UL8-3]|uniref:sugar-transfer associated ATP-grasp domain-containing protein n=1 Tax=Roseovarius conchicola TaxID=3121636 RepID=UPI003529C560
MSDTTAPRVLLAAPAKPTPPASQMIVDVARKYGVSPFAQFGQMIRLWMGQHRLQFDEYYANAVFRKDLAAEEKRQFVGEGGSRRLNNRLSPHRVTSLRPFVRNKVFYGAMMENLGFPTPRIQAVASHNRSFGTIPALREVEQIEQFLLNDARYPLFVKPEVGSGSVGSALIVELDRETRELVLSNGTRVDLRAFATEALEDYAEGFLFQDAVDQHSDLSDVAGRAVGTIRVVTVMADDEAPQVLYTLWKVPSPKAMSDNYWQDGSMLAEIDKTSGVLKQCRRGSGPDQEVLDTHPVSQKAFAGMQVPHWEEVLRLATSGHQLMPQFGVFGWDIGITQDGPMIIECNSNPHHMLYQLATGKGILNNDFAPILKQVEDRSEELRAEVKAAYVKHLKEQR